MSSLFPVGTGTFGQAQLGAVTGMDMVQSGLAALVTVMVILVPTGMPVMLVAPTVPAVLVTVPPVAVKSTE